MSLAIGALILVLLLMPGISIISAFYSSFTNKASRIHIPFTELLPKGLLLSVFIHCITICILATLNFKVDFIFLHEVISKDKISINNATLESYFRQFIMYILILVVLGFIVGKITKRFVQNKNLDLVHNSLKTTSYWFHMFGGRHLEAPGIPGALVDIDFVYLDVLTDKDILYSGRLLDFNYSPYKDELENIVLINSQKRRVKGENIEPYKCQMTESKLIPGNALVIKASTIVNINIFYISLSDVSSSELDKEETEEK